MIAVHNNTNILGIQTHGRFKIKTLSYADDVTVTVSDETSVHQIFAHIYSLSTHMRREISNKIESFIAGDSRLISPIDTLELPLSQGGYTVPNITLYCDILYLKPLAEYCQHRKENTDPTPACALIEHNIGLQLSRLLSIPFKNYLPTQNYPTSYTHTHWRSAKNTTYLLKIYETSKLWQFTTHK